MVSGAVSVKRSIPDAARWRHGYGREVVNGMRRGYVVDQRGEAGLGWGRLFKVTPGGLLAIRYGADGRAVNDE
jgi:hypothetical protein